jgi:DNA anti-recombination protein RmuC
MPVLAAFVLKLKTPGWRLCVVKQVPAQSSSCWMLFGQNRKTKTTFQMEFQPHYETTLINHLTDMAEADETELRLVLVDQPPAVSCIASLWALQGQEMYRKQLRTASSLNSSLHQDMNMLRISPQMQQSQQPHQQPHQQQQEIKSRHSMQTRSKTK